MADAAVQIEKVYVDYLVGGNASRSVLNGISLQIESGEFVAIVGETGCGKSTLLRLILGQEKPTQGRLLVNGCERWQPDVRLLPMTDERCETHVVVELDGQRVAIHGEPG